MLIDYDVICENEKIKKFGNKPEIKLKNYKIGLLLKVRNDIYKKISTISKGENRLNFFFSPEFEKGILFQSFCFYNKKKELCFIEADDSLEKNLKIIEDILPLSTTIWTKIDIKKGNFELICQKICKNDFVHPYIKENFLIVNKKNKNRNSNPNLVSNKIHNLLSNSSDNCHFYAKLSTEAVEYLKTLSEKGHTKNKDGSSSQKELTGDLIIKDANKVKNKIVYEIDVNHSSVASGEEELVNVNRTRYNFHSHPREAYVRHSVHKAWPSIVDFNGLLDLGIETIFHCVATIEGVYIMSFSKYWHSRIADIDKSFVDKNFDIDHKKNMTPSEYVSKINDIKLDNHPIFHLWFFEWNKATTLFEIEYSPIDGICFQNQESIDFHKKNFS